MSLHSTNFINKVAVYGSLKEGHWNHWLLKDSELEGIFDVSGYKMYRDYPDFPLIRPSENTLDKIRVEVYNIDYSTLAKLDRLENEGYMYDRAVINIDDVGLCFIYVGTYSFWGDCKSLELCEKNKNEIYEWGLK